MLSGAKSAQASTEESQSGHTWDSHALVLGLGGCIGLRGAGCPANCEHRTGVASSRAHGPGLLGSNEETSRVGAMALAKGV